MRIRFTTDSGPLPPPPAPEELENLEEDEAFWGNLAKHMGPGPHPSGSPQTVHGSRRVHVGRGTGKRGGKPVDKLLVDADGNELPLSFDALTDAHIMINGKVSATDKAAEIQDKILARLDELGLDPSSVDRNLDLVWRSAMARYEADPSLIDQDRFYEMWHEAYFNIAEDNGIEFSRVIAAGSAISPGLNAWSNIHYANEIATWITDDVAWEGEQAQEMIDYLDEVQDGILNPVWHPDHEGVINGDHEPWTPKDPPKEGGFRWGQGQEVLADYEALKGRDSFKLSDIQSSYTAAYALHKHRAMNGGLAADVPEHLAIDHQTGRRLEQPQGGFSVKNMSFFGSAVGVIRGDITVSESLGDVKTRSFYNNILDPADSLGMGDITVDYHMANAAFMAADFDKSNAISSPTIEGVGVGIRPLVADGIRRFVGQDLNGETLTSGRVQEILWAEWSRGQREQRHVPSDVPQATWYDPKKSTRTITHWQGFDGTWYPLYNLKRRTT